MTKYEEEINSKITNIYWNIIVTYKGVDAFLNAYYCGADSVHLDGYDNMLVFYQDRNEPEVIPMCSSRLKFNMNDFIMKRIEKIQWK